MCECTTDENWVRLMDCTNVNWVWYLTYTSCYHGGKLGEGYPRSLPIISYNCMWIYNCRKIKSTKKESTGLLLLSYPNKNLLLFLNMGIMLTLDVPTCKVIKYNRVSLNVLKYASTSWLPPMNLFISIHTQWLYFSC